MITKLNLMIANVYLVSSFIREHNPRLILVDSGAPRSASKILNEIAKAGYSPTDVALILLTHGHSDHAGSACELRKLTGAPVALHQGDLEMVQRGNNGKLLPTDWEAALSLRVVDQPFPAFEPDIILQESNDLSKFGLQAHILHTPGHSPGSISILFENGDAIVGDILRGGILGGMLFSSHPKYPFFLYDMVDRSTVLNSVQRVLDAGAQRLYTGHGGPLSRQAVQRWLAVQTAHITAPTKYPA